jgi:tRNA-2-methylthio-N6-dimethylallyladenosine synthase
MKQVYMETFGCQMNVADSDRMEQLLFQSGYVRTPQKEDADLILINTCSIRDKAEHKIYSLLGTIKPLKKDNPDMTLALSGCLAQQEGEALVKKFPYLDMVLGPDAVERVVEAVDYVKTQKKPLVWTDFDKEKTYSIPISEEPAAKLTGPSAFVNIIKGCDKFCSFCVVPFTRGREKSREAQEIYSEVEQLVAQGAKEIILLGQNVNAYGKRDMQRLTPFHELLYGVAEIPGVERLRFTTSHPKDFTKETAHAFRDLDVLVNQLHLPVQSGNNRILDGMRRGYSVEDYKTLVDLLRSEAPSIAFSTDIIVGFPGETDDEFEDTLRLMDWVGYDSSYIFSYSPRPGTPALEMEDSVSDAIKKDRLQATIDLQKSLSDQNGKQYLGRQVEVLVESETSRQDFDFKGRSPHYWMVNFSGGRDTLKPGDLVKVQVHATSGHGLKGIYSSSN